MREYQAILPLRGKIINAYKSREDKVLANEEVRSMISAIGCGIGEDIDVSQPPLRQDRHHDRCRRRRLPHPHPAARPSSTARCTTWSQPATSTWPSRRCSACRRKKEVYYVQTEEEMKAQLLEAGLADAVFEPGRRPRHPGRRNGPPLPHPGRPGRRPRGPGTPRHQPPQPTPSARTPPPAGCRSTTSSSAARNTGSPRARNSTNSSPSKRPSRATNSTSPTAQPANGETNGAGHGRKPRAAHRRAPRGPLDQQPPGRSSQNGLRDRQPHPAGADRDRRAPLPPPPRRRARWASTTSAAC